MKGPSEHHHVALLAAGVALSAVAMLTVTPSAAAVLATGGAGVILGMAPSSTAGRRPPLRIRVTRTAHRRPMVRTQLQPAGPVARGVGVVRRLVGVMLRTALAYLDLSKSSRNSKLVLTTTLR